MPVSRTTGDQYARAYYGSELEKERQSQVAAERAGEFGRLGRELGADAAFGRMNADDYSLQARNRSNQLYGAAGGMYDAAGATTGQQNAVRGDTMAAIGRLRSFYEQPAGPSVAEAQLRQGQASANRNAMSIARTGGGSPASMRAAIRAGAAGNQQANQAAATLRAQETAAHRQQVLGAMGMEQSALSGVRGADIGVLGTQFGAAAQREGAALGAGNLGLGYGNLGATYNQQGVAGRIGAGTLQAGQYNLGEGNRTQLTSSGMAMAGNRYSADQGTTVGMAQVDQRREAADRAMYGTLIGAGVGMLAGGPGGAAAGGTIGSNISDVRAKENVRPTSAAGMLASLDRFANGGNDLRAAGSYSYDYTDPRFGPDNQVGPMAQELERTDASGAVTTGPDGMKSVDPSRLTMVNTSAIAEQQRRLDRLDNMLAAPKSYPTNGQRIIDRIEMIENRKLSEDDMRRLASGGGSGSLKPEDEEFIRQRVASRGRAR